VGIIWDAIPDLSVPDADVGVYFLAQNSVAYLEPVNDPWFHANISRSFSDSVNEYFYYYSTKLVNVMGCMKTLRICNFAQTSCTSWVGSYQIEPEIKRIALTAEQYASAYRLYVANLYADVFGATLALGSSGKNQFRAHIRLNIF
jgi:hypothetical protein